MLNKIKIYFMQVCNEMICLDEVPEPASKTTIGLDFWVRSIISYSTEIYETFEKNLWYVLYFTDTAFNVPIYNVNWSTDIRGNIVITIFWFLAFIFNFIGSLLPYILMMFANFITSGYLQKIILGMGNWVNETIFGWSGNNGNTFGISLIVICSVLSIALVVMKNYKELTPKKVLKMITQVILTATVVGFLAPRAIEVGETIDTRALSFLNLAQINEQQEMPLNVKVKNELYELLILQPYLIQNFDVGSIDELQQEINNLNMNMDATELIEGVIKCSQESGQEKCLENLYSGIKNNGLFSIIHSNNFSTQVGALPKSYLLMIHKTILSIPFFFIFFAYAIVDFIKWMSLIFATFFLVSMIFRESPNYFSYFINRIKWAFISWGFSLGLTISIALMMNMVTTIMSMTSVFTILIFDILLAGIFMFIWINKKRLSRILFRLIGFGMMFAGRSAMVGSYSPSNGSDDLKSEFKNLNANFKQMNTNIEKNMSNIDNQEQHVNESTDSGDDNRNSQTNKPLHAADEIDGDLSDHSTEINVGNKSDSTTDEVSGDVLSDDSIEQSTDANDKAEASNQEQIDGDILPENDDELDPNREPGTINHDEIAGDDNIEQITDTNELNANDKAEASNQEQIDSDILPENNDELNPNREPGTTDNNELNTNRKQVVENQELDTKTNKNKKISDVFTDEDVPPKTSYDKYKNFSTTFEDDIPIRRKRKGEQDEKND